MDNDPRADETPSNTPDELRRRAAALTDLADRIDGPVCAALARLRPDPGAPTPSVDLAERLLATNLHQLHSAAEHLRTLAWRLRRRAEMIEREVAA